MFSLFLNLVLYNSYFHGGSEIKPSSFFVTTLATTCISWSCFEVDQKFLFNWPPSFMTVQRLILWPDEKLPLSYSHSKYLPTFQLGNWGECSSITSAFMAYLFLMRQLKNGWSKAFSLEKTSALANLRIFAFKSLQAVSFYSPLP